jgi:hypothetical protein
VFHSIPTKIKSALIPFVGKLEKTPIPIVGKFEKAPIRIVGELKKNFDTNCWNVEVPTNSIEKF